MACIASRKHPTRPSTFTRGMAASLLTGLALTVPAHAGSTDANDPQVRDARRLPGIEVRATRGADYRADMVDSPKFTQPLLDTPQTIGIITRDLFEQQGATTLTEALRNSPGVGTFYVGENGSTTTGDGIYMRGFDTSGSIFVDGVRDLGSISRDLFNIEQVEVTKGPDGTEYGRTAPTGAVNMVTRQPVLDDRAGASLGYGSGQQRRASADLNRQIGDHSAFRLDAVGQDSGVPGRDRVRNRRWGVAPALAFGLGTPTRVYLDVLHIRQTNVPDGGVPTLGLPGYTSPDPVRPRIGLAPRVDSANFYGTAQDHDEVTADMLTLIVEHQFNPDLSLRNTTRWGRTRQDYLLTSFRGDAAHLLTPDLADPSTWAIERSLPTFKRRSNRILTNQTNLRVDFATGTVIHNLSAGLELTGEKASDIDLAPREGSTWPAANLYHPDPRADGLRYGETGAWSTGTTNTAAAYVFDTLKFGPRWQVTAGARLDRYTTRFDSVSLCGERNSPACGALPAGTPVPGLSARIVDTLPNGKLGVLYKPVPNGSIYANLALSQEPPGGNTLLFSSSARSADNPGLDPQRASTTELGTKWDLLDQRLLLTAALYRTVVRNELTQDPVDQQYYQAGRKRVQGIELGIVGRITDDWGVSAGFTTMDAKVTEGASVSNDGSSDLAYTPASAFTAWTTYHLPFGLTVGGGARYAGAMKRGTDGAIGTPGTIGAYWVFDAMASLPVNRHLDLQLNLYNLFDRHYVAAINKSGYRYTPGTPRAAMLTANIRF
ncbi:catecholate siderophore receptor Fiu [Frateuria soli]|uniref:catecholate siderophore receptor Fiu n=1 Tax=Frateuria soli TaxID=1542730 RepID=UPI001E429828|nr:catecholate siderophore receptor Fiu [Frateuria soli]UGB37020.1 catecholate siderophore receptor Fiu [Frateuria soli]